MENSVSALKKLTLSQLTLPQKLEIKTRGRPKPNLSIVQLSSSRGNAYSRQFNPSVYEDYNWLCGCNETNALYCFPCLLFGGDPSWTKSGIKDLNHMKQKICKHNTSIKHMNNMINLSMLGKGNIATELDSGYKASIVKHNEMVTKNRTVLSKIIDCIKFCGKFELPLRGHDESSTSENSGVFRGLVEFACGLDSSFAAHFNSATVFKGTSKTIQNEIMESILELCQEEIKKQVVNSEFLAVMCDETTDIHDKTQMVIVFRYELKGKPVERFWGFFNPENQTAEALSAVLLGELAKLIGDCPHKLIAQTYDGAAALSGVHSGVQTRIKEFYPNAHFLHCYAHQLNLILQKATSQNTSARIFLTVYPVFQLFFLHLLLE